MSPTLHTFDTRIVFFKDCLVNFLSKRNRYLQQQGCQSHYSEFNNDIKFYELHDQPAFHIQLNRSGLFYVQHVWYLFNKSRKHRCTKVSKLARNLF